LKNEKASFENKGEKFVLLSRRSGFRLIMDI